MWQIYLLIAFVGVLLSVVFGVFILRHNLEQHLNDEKLENLQKRKEGRL